MLVVKDLVKAFRTPDGESVEIVRVERFELGNGEQRALRGSSGSGKTTFLHLIAGILAADAGSVQVGGVDMTSLSESDRDRRRA